MSRISFSLGGSPGKQLGQWRRKLKRAAALFLLILVVAVLAAATWLYSSLPVTRATLSVPGLNKSTDIIRDLNGIPTIVAGSEQDAAFALGFVHAQDRLFQMDLRRRLGAGRLSEVMGAPALGSDRWMRTLGLYRLAAASLPYQSEGFRAVLTAYADGVNAYLASRRGALPLEFTILGYRPEPWQPADTLVLGKLLQLELSGNFRRELLKARLIKTLPADTIQQLFPNHPMYNPAAVPHLSDVLEKLPLDGMLATVPDAVGPVYASNTWIVDGRHTVSGKPLLANDPHLGFSTPGAWYLCAIETPKLSQAGATIAGIPIIALGHNHKIAWGFTATLGDVQDLFVEQVDPADRSRYLAPDGPQPFVTRSEVVNVRDTPAVTMTVRSTRHGPVISDAAPGLSPLSNPSHLLSLATTFLLEDDRSMEAIWNLGRAEDWSAFTRALQIFRAPQQTMSYADTAGNIGFYAAGTVPIRRSGDGTLPAPGWSGAYDWSGSVPFDELPHAFNPPAGKLAFANNKVTPPDYPHLITYDWTPTFRVDRIKALLDATTEHSADSFSRIMADDLSASAALMLPQLLRTKPAGSLAQRAMQLLSAWDFRMSHDRPEPLIFTGWIAELNRQALAGPLGNQLRDYQSILPIRPELITTHFASSCDAQAKSGLACNLDIGAALDLVLARLAARYGNDPEKWRWGAAHTAYFAHPLYSRFSWFRSMTNPSIASSGGNDTVNPGTSRLGDPNVPFLHIDGAGLRAIYDLDNLANSSFMITPGQSGNILATHYNNFVKPWRDFEWVVLRRPPSGDLIRLTPQTAPPSG
jgi:penicillin G amidase